MSPNPPPVRLFFDRPVSLALVLALVCPHASAAEPSAAAPSPTLEVEIAPTVPDAEVLAGWIREESTDALTRLDPAPSRPGTILISISGDLYDYQVSITTIRDGSARQESVSWPCTCTNDELLAQLRTDVEAAAGSLAGTSVPDGQPTSSTRRHRASFQDLELRGRVGLGLLAAGAAGTIAGAAFLGAGDRTPSGPDYRIPGVPTLIIGLGLLATGTTFIVLQHRDLRRRRALARASAFPSVTQRSIHMSFTARF